MNTRLPNLTLPQVFELLGEKDVLIAQQQLLINQLVAEKTTAPAAVPGDAPPKDHGEQ